MSIFIKRGWCWCWMAMTMTMTTTMTTTTTTTTIKRLKWRKSCQLLSKMSGEILILKGRRSRSRSKGLCNPTMGGAVLNPLVTFGLSSMSLMPCRGTWKVWVHRNKSTVTAQQKNPIPQHN